MERPKAPAVGAGAQALAAEKDSLITEVLETSKFVNGINEELAKARTALVATARSRGDDVGRAGRLPGARRRVKDGARGWRCRSAPC